MVLDFIFYNFILFYLALLHVERWYLRTVLELGNVIASTFFEEVWCSIVVGSRTKNRRILEFTCETSGVKFHIARTM